LYVGCRLNTLYSDWVSEVQWKYVWAPYELVCQIMHVSTTKTRTACPPPCTSSAQEVPPHMHQSSILVWHTQPSTKIQEGLVTPISCDPGMQLSAAAALKDKMIALIQLWHVDERRYSQG
jgi:hypothetical protein